MCAGTDTANAPCDGKSTVGVRTWFKEIAQTQLYMNNLENNNDPVVFENLAGMEYASPKSQ